MSPVGESKLSSYDGLLANSTELWRKFLKLYEDRFDKFWYNVRVGAGTRPPLATSPEMQRMWWATTCLRIDVVGERPGESWVFEVVAASDVPRGWQPTTLCPPVAALSGTDRDEDGCHRGA